MPATWAKLERVGVATTVLVPIAVGGRNLAVLTIGDGDPERLREADMELAIDLGRRSASALERARLWQASRQQLEAEHRLVELLQRTIVPDRLPEIAGVKLAAAYRPAELDIDVGGDWYDAFVAPDGSIVVVVADVAGHGIQAASLMGRVRNALRAYAIEDSDPASILVRLHSLLRAQDATEMVTGFVGRFDPDSKDMTWSRAGHPPPLVVQPDGYARFLDDVNGAPLGAMARPYANAKVALPAGALVVCYTDGLVERRDRILDEGLDWLRERVLEHASDEPEALCDKLVDDPFVPHPAPDDLCVLILRTEAP
jgi:serine phosphatase RsbU (regulator of sigma subunit)